MNNVSIRQLLFFFAIIAVSMALFIVGANFFLYWAIDVESPSETNLPEFIPENGIKIKSPDEAELTPTVIYENGIFRPKRVIRDGTGTIGCVVILVNRAPNSLRVGINPHSPFGDPGPNYEPIAPGDKLIFDPRFPGITELTFHNHDNPEEEFTVELGAQCQ